MELFTAEFRKRYPQSCFLLDGEGYKDKDLDLNTDGDGNELDLERYLVEVSHTIQQGTSYVSGDSTAFFHQSGVKR